MVGAVEICAGAAALAETSVGLWLMYGWGRAGPAILGASGVPAPEAGRIAFALGGRGVMTGLGIALAALGVLGAGALVYLLATVLAGALAAAALLPGPGAGARGSGRLILALPALPAALALVAVARLGGAG